MKLFTFVAPPELIRRAKQRAREEDRSVASLIRKLLAEYVSKGAGDGSRAA